MTRREALWLTWDVLVFVLRWALIIAAALIEVAVALLGMALMLVLAVVTLGAVAGASPTRRSGRRLAGVMLVDAAFDRPRRRRY